MKDQACPQCGEDLGDPWEHGANNEGEYTADCSNCGAAVECELSYEWRVLGPFVRGTLLDGDDEEDATTDPDPAR